MLTISLRRVPPVGQVTETNKRGRFISCWEFFSWFSCGPPDGQVVVSSLHTHKRSDVPASRRLYTHHHRRSRIPRACALTAKNPLPFPPTLIGGNGSYSTGTETAKPPVATNRLDADISAKESERASYRERKLALLLGFGLQALFFFCCEVDCCGSCGEHESHRENMDQRSDGGGGGGGGCARLHQRRVSSSPLYGGVDVPHRYHQQRFIRCR